MTNEEQRIAIAEACGWKFFCVNSLGDRVYHGPNGQVAGVPKKGGYEDPDYSLPDYLNDLNAIRKVILALPPEKRGYYNAELSKIVLGRNLSAAVKESEFIFDLLNADADQCAEAFLRTLNLWKD